MTEFEYSYKNCHTDFDWERAAYYIYTEFHWLPQQFLLHYGKDGLHLIEDVTPYDEVYGRRHIDEFFFDKEQRWKKGRCFRGLTIQVLLLNQNMRKLISIIQ